MIYGWKKYLAYYLDFTGIFEINTLFVIIGLIVMYLLNYKIGVITLELGVIGFISYFIIDNFEDKFVDYLHNVKY